MAMDWIHMSDTAISEVLPAQKRSRILLIFLCFLADSEVSAGFLQRTAQVRKVWTVNGHVGEASSTIDADIGSLLDVSTGLREAMLELQNFSTVTRTDRGTYMVNSTTRADVLRRLPPAAFPFWRNQALAAALHAVPWKYLAPPDWSMTTMLTTHITHTTSAVRDLDGYASLAGIAKFDSVLALIEASRFPDWKWKLFAVEQAKAIMPECDDQYLEASVAQRQAVLDRISGNNRKPTAAIVPVHHPASADSADRRAHASLGLTIIQHALDFFQKERLLQALEALDSWKPLDTPSPCEITVLFRLELRRGRILRTGGKFKEALHCLEKTCKLVDEYPELHFDEDAGDLACEMADAMRELNDAAAGADLVASQLMRPNHSDTTQTLLNLSLAECLFALHSYDEADRVCQHVTSQSGLCKMAKLRLCVTMAKLRHISRDWDGACSWWTKAVVAVSRFPLTGGTAPRLVNTSLSDALQRQGSWQEKQAGVRAEVARLKGLAHNVEGTDWIPGFQCWLRQLESLDVELYKRV